LANPFFFAIFQQSSNRIRGAFETKHIIKVLCLPGMSLLNEVSITIKRCLYRGMASLGLYVFNVLSLINAECHIGMPEVVEVHPSGLCPSQYWKNCL
jgi:hypothetical protein